MTAIVEWLEAHPVIAGSTIPIVVYAVVGLINRFVRPRTPEEYERIAKLSPRLAVFLQLLNALGLDSIRVGEVLPRFRDTTLIKSAEEMRASKEKE